MDISIVDRIESFELNPTDDSMTFDYTLNQWNRLEKDFLNLKAHEVFDVMIRVKWSPYNMTPKNNLRRLFHKWETQIPHTNFDKSSFKNFWNCHK